MTTKLSGVVAAHIVAVNAFDTDAIVATFAEDAYVNDNRREINGANAIRRFVAKEFVGDRVTMEVREVLDHYGDTVVRARCDGTYDKTNLPDELIMSSYFSVLAPAYIEVGDLDMFRDESISYAQQLARAGVTIELHVHPGAPHGFERLAPGSNLAQRAMGDRARAVLSF
jgi:acetyl esterase/lipase